MTKTGKQDCVPFLSLTNAVSFLLNLMTVTLTRVGTVKLFADCELAEICYVTKII
jgi:hypothetical protein